jgi:hypothetical protein
MDAFAPVKHVPELSVAGAYLYSPSGMVLYTADPASDDLQEEKKKGASKAIGASKYWVFISKRYD